MAPLSAFALRRFGETSEDLVSITRRELVHALGAAGSAAFLPSAAAGQAANRTAAGDGAPADRTVHMSGDGFPLSARAFTSLLDTLTRQADIE